MSETKTRRKVKRIYTIAPSDVVVEEKFTGKSNFVCLKGELQSIINSIFRAIITNIISMVLIRYSLLVLIILILGSFKVQAQDMVPGIIVELANGQKIEYRIADKPKMVFDGSKITLTAEGVTVEYTPTELLKVTTGDIKNTGTDIKEMNIQSGDIKIDAGFIRLSGFAVGEFVNVYSVNGILQASYQISDSGSLVIPFASLSLGISIIQVNNQSVKISRK